MNTNVQKMIHDYVNAWNENNLKDFKNAFSKIWNEEATYIDPQIDNIKGVDAIAQLAMSSLEKFPGRRFEVLTEPDTHHNVGRYNWKAIFSDGNTVEGFDCFEFDNQYKITKIVSFF
ncbi:nuclear transport factor 2 family protein [Rhizosphaericola mali]|uniref:Nuclear transport factor 2 family protein n=1 Tax=Rhizosphaericola mali TaxID=2545455 RepID=A0A5P2FYR4_9BACT|nr:nuclear transport factor 2 family protein [Rhizosphaericola mali]QES88335.1 nuclear transport factor 2 family protein [Rhizosphaericola mali]